MVRCPCTAALPALLLLMTLAAGCGSSNETAEPDSTTVMVNVATATPPPITRPPSGTASSASGSVPLGLGSYCWDIACADALAIVTTSDVLTIPRGEAIRVNTAGTARITEVQVFQAYAQPVPEETYTDGLLAWTPPPESGNNVAFTLDAGEVTFAADLAPGRYVLSFLAIFADPKGDASYGFQVEVR